MLRIYIHLFYLQAAPVVRRIPFPQRLSKGRKKFPLQMIHASPVQTMGLGVFADGRSFYKPLIIIIGVVAQNCFQAVLQKELSTPI